jgi:hypothetical protein
MDEGTDLKVLPIALVVVGITFEMGVYTLTIIWPAGWIWDAEGEHSHYLQMILGVYATLGVFLILASRDPLKNLSLIWFTVWSSLVHGGIMAIQAFVYPEHRGHLLGDAPALLVIALVLAVLTPRGEQVVGADARLARS